MASRPLAAATVALILTAGAAACGSSDDAADSTTTTTAAATSPTSTGSSTDGSQLTKVNANTASIDQLAAAFEAAGVPNAERWAREVDEYRPYSGTDDWAHLKQELSKYNIDDDTLQRILSVLEV